MKGSERERLPNRRASIAYCFNFEGHNYLATSSNFDDGRLAEIFLDAGKVGSAVQYHASTGAILASLLLQHGVDVETVRHSVHGPIGVALDYISASPRAYKGRPMTTGAVTGAVIPIRPTMPTFEPVFDMTFRLAEVEYAKVPYWLRNADPETALATLTIVATRMFRLRYHELLGDRDVDGHLWQAAEMAGLVTRHGATAVQDVLGGTADAVRSNPNEDPDRRAGPIIATAYTWTEPAQIPPRDWIYGRRLLRKFVTATVAPGGVGKSSLEISEALAMVSGRNLLGITPAKRYTVWLWNLEDPRKETARRIQATAKHFGLTAVDLGNRLYVDCVREQPLVIAQTLRTGAVICSPVVDALVAQIIARKIDVLIIDPFVSCHEVPKTTTARWTWLSKNGAE